MRHLKPIKIKMFSISAVLYCELDVALAQVINFICGASIVLQAMEPGVYVMQALAKGSGIKGGFPSSAVQRISFERELKFS